MHRTLQIIGTIFIGIGLFAIVINKIELEKSLFPSTLHSLFGAISIILIFVQIIIGLEKMELTTKSHLVPGASVVKSRRWHGNAGLLTWDCLIATILLGNFQFLGITLLNLITCMLVICVWLSVHIQFRASVGGLSPTHDGSTSVFGLVNNNNDSETGFEKTTENSSNI